MPRLCTPSTCFSCAADGTGSASSALRSFVSAWSCSPYSPHKTGCNTAICRLAESTRAMQYTSATWMSVKTWPVGLSPSLHWLALHGKYHVPRLLAENSTATLEHAGMHSGCDCMVCSRHNKAPGNQCSFEACTHARPCNMPLPAERPAEQILCSVHAQQYGRCKTTWQPSLARNPA